MKVYRFYLSFSPGHSVTVGLCDERWELAMALLHEEVVDVVGFLDLLVGSWWIFCSWIFRSA